MTSQPDPPRPSGSGFFTWLRNLGVTRSQDRWAAGVAGGLAHRAGIDPLIVRGIFVVLAIVGGPAVLIYAAGWLLMPDTAKRIHAEDIVRGRADSSIITMAVIACAVILLPVIFAGAGATGVGLFSWFGTWEIWHFLGLPAWLISTLAWLFWLAVLVAVAFGVRHLLIERGRAQNARPADEPPSADDAHEPQGASNTGTNSDTDWSQKFTDQANLMSEKAQHFGEKAEQWTKETTERVDAWSARYATEHEARKIGAGHVLITLAFTLLAAGIAAVFALRSGLEFSSPEGTISTFTPSLIAALIAAVAVLAVSVIVAGLRGRNSGSIGFWSFCGVIALLITAVLPWGSRFQPFGNLQLDGQSVGSVSIAGNVSIDLSDLDYSPKRDLTVWHGGGNIDVEMPEHAPVIVEVRVLAGEINETHPSDSTKRISGVLLSQTSSANLPASLPVSTAAKSVSHVTVYLLGGKATVTAAPETSQSRLLMKGTTR